VTSVAWVHKGVRTLLAVAPGLIVFVTTSDERGVAFAFAALCLSVPYGDQAFRPAHLVGSALASALLMPILPWLHHRPVVSRPSPSICRIRTGPCGPRSP